LRAATPGANSMTRKMVPFFSVVPTFRRPSSAAPSLFAGKPSVVQTSQAVAPGRPEKTFFETSSGHVSPL
jgi:hypothetical protein